VDVMTIWIAKKHPRHPYSAFGWLDTFTIAATFPTRKEAQEFVNKKMGNRNTSMLYTVGKVELK
jgi:hypothetical protein